MTRKTRGSVSAEYVVVASLLAAVALGAASLPDLFGNYLMTAGHNMEAGGAHVVLNDAPSAPSGAEDDAVADPGDVDRSGEDGWGDDPWSGSGSEGEGTGNDNNRSGLGDGTNPGQGGGTANSPNQGTDNPNNAPHSGGAGNGTP